MNGRSESTFEMWLKAMSPLLGIAALVWGIYTYQNTAELQNERTAETRRVEASRPFLEKQLNLYTEVAKTASILATSDDQLDIRLATSRFYQLYYGELALVERAKVITAMVAFKSSLDLYVKDGKSRSDLGALALNLVHACREELAESWGTDAWDK
jgi:hypothetical protein